MKVFLPNREAKILEEVNRELWILREHLRNESENSTVNTKLILDRIDAIMNKISKGAEKQ